VIYRFAVGRLSCAVISDGQMTPPWEPPLAALVGRLGLLRDLGILPDAELTVT
jgi:hypothetical protein